MEYQWEPLGQWPGKEPGEPKWSRFHANRTDTMDRFERELQCLGATRVVIQADIDRSQLRMDGTLRNNATFNSSRVIVSFDSRHGPMCFPCATFSTTWCNVRAIALSMEALRKMDRYGVTQTGEQYRGWAALPPPGVNGGFRDSNEAAEFLALIVGVSRSNILDADNTLRETFFRMAEKKTHPDLGGDPAEFDKVQKARKVLLA